jgi:hypothetical protein
MREKKPCGICRRWFKPDPRAGSRQRVCSAEVCQAERRRRNAAAWRERNAEELEADRLRAGLQAKPPPTEAVATAAPLSRLSPRAVRIAVGLKTEVVIAEYAKVVLAAQQIAVSPKAGFEGRDRHRVQGAAPRIETDSARAPP